jgi:hypothetical protein
MKFRISSFPLVFVAAVAVVVPSMRGAEGAAPSTQRPPTEKSPLTALDRYVHRPDPAYAWKVAGSVRGEGGQAFFLDLTSQSWLTTNEVNRTVWRHWLVVARPDNLAHSTALLFIGGGANKDDKPPKVNNDLVRIARETKSVVAELKMVPNQPLIFGGDGAERVEDDLIAYTWDKFLRTGDEKWPARLPMTKSAVRAMDALTAFCASEAGGKAKVDTFVVAGGSKRGWTTWTTAITDRRVVAICPIVIDVLNLEESMFHHYQAYGFWAPAVGNYVEHGIMDWMKTPQMRALCKIEDPFEYRDRLTLPKLVMNACGDQFFLPDSSQFYFDQLPGPKYLRYIPNTDHSLKGSDAYETLAAWHQLTLSGGPAAGIHLDPSHPRFGRGPRPGSSGRGQALAGHQSRRARFPDRDAGAGLDLDAGGGRRQRDLPGGGGEAGEGLAGVRAGADLRRRIVGAAQGDHRRASDSGCAAASGAEAVPAEAVTRRATPRVGSGQGGVDADLEFEADAFAEDRFQFPAGGAADVANAGAAGADEHAFVAFLGDQEVGFDVQDRVGSGFGGGARAFLGDVDAHGGAVGHFLLGLEVDLFADDLADPEGEAGVGDFAHREERFADGQERADDVDERLEVEPGGGGNFDDRGVLLGADVPGVPKRALLQVGLVEAEDAGLGHAGEGFDDHLFFRADRPGGVDDMDQGVDPLQGLPGAGVQPVDQGAATGAEEARGIDEDELDAGAVDDALDGVAGGLGFGADDRDFRVDEGVEERGLADVGTSDQGDQPGAESGGGGGGGGRGRVGG